MNTETTPALIRSLRNPALYPHPVESVTLIETHISWVLLAGDYAYKIKKPLDLGFLDFSSLEKRRHFCQEELRLNSRLAPDVYLEVLAICGNENTPQFNGTGPVIDYAVKMRRFNENATFDHLLNDALLTNDLINDTARIIARFHASIPPAPVDSAYGWPEAVMHPVRENFRQIERLQDLDSEELLASLLDWSECQYSDLRHVFAQRKRDGFIRECHGDLHLANIALIDDRVVPFDGIEFNPELYWIDVISEVGFLVMDLTDKRRSNLAFQFLNGYLQQGGDYAGLKLLPFYLVYRAMVRAKVNAIRTCQTDDPDQRQQSFTDFHTYLQLATDYTKPQGPVLLLMHGVSGSGKSWLSERLLEQLPGIRIRSDVERKRLFQQSSDQPTYTGIETGLYDANATARTYHRLLTLAGDILAAGFSVIVDATFLKEQQRRPFFELAAQSATPLRIIDTVADRHTLERRLLLRSSQQNNESDADQKVLQHQLQTAEPLTDEELHYTYHIDTADTQQLTAFWASLDELKH